MTTDDIYLIYYGYCVQETLRQDVSTRPYPIGTIRKGEEARSAKRTKTVTRYISYLVTLSSGRSCFACGISCNGQELVFPSPPAELLTWSLLGFICAAVRSRGQLRTGDTRTALPLPVEQCQGTEVPQDRINTMTPFRLPSHSLSSLYLTVTQSLSFTAFYSNSQALLQKPAHK
jgi:hypothetical protein